MPTLSASNRTQLAYKLEGTYPTNYGVLQAGNGTLVNLVSESLDFTTKTETSKVIRSDRQTTDLIQVSGSAQGGFGFEHIYKDMDPLLEALYQSTFTAYGTNGVSAALSGVLNLASGTVTAAAAPTGNDALTGLQRGQWFGIEPAAAASQTVKDYFNGRVFRVSSTTAPTATVITLDAATPINTAIAGASLAAGATISSSRMTNGTTMKSYSLEVGHLDINVYRQYLGMIPSKLDLKISVGAIVTGSLEFMGKTMTVPLPTVTGMGTPAAASTYESANAIKGVFDIIEGGASITASTFIKSADISIDNSLRGQEAVGVYGNAGIAAGTLAVSGKLEVYFADGTMYNKFLQNTVSSISIPVLDNAGNGYVYVFPRVKYSASKVNAGGLDQDNVLSMDFTALMDTDATSSTYQKTVALYRIGA